MRSTLGSGSSFALVAPLAVESPAATQRAPSLRQDVVVATANRGLERHLKSLMYELNIEPVSIQTPPVDDALAASQHARRYRPLSWRMDRQHRAISA